MYSKEKFSIEDIEPHLSDINLLQCKPGFKTGERKLFSYYFLYVHKGKGIFTIGNKSYEAITGDLFFCEPEISNSIIADGKDPFLLTGIIFSFTSMSDESPYKKETDIYYPSKDFVLIHLADFEGFPDKISIPEDVNIRSSLYEMINEYNQKKTYWSQYVNGILKAVIIKLVRYVKQNKCGVKNGCKGEEVIRFLADNYMHELTNQKVAEKFHYHPDYLNKILNTYTGITLKQYIINLRISAAINLLIRGDMDIKSIASVVGYENLQYFYRIFKQKTGFSPGYFKQNTIS